MQYVDNISIGAWTLEYLRSITHQVLARFDESGIKANYDKVRWVTGEIQFLGCETSSGSWSHERFLKRKQK